MKYIRMHKVDAEPMKFGEFKDKYPKSGGANVERGADDDGYVIFYRGGEYVSWCPKKEFEDVSRPCDGMTFGEAIEQMKRGAKVARKGWNGKGMWLLLGHNITFTASVESTDEEKSFDVLKSIVMRTAQDNFVVGWLASQTDMLAEDWEIVL
nr:MAG TPA: Protein of unknown function (DUF2829) [Caudoviricetes sp.]